MSSALPLRGHRIDPDGLPPCPPKPYRAPCAWPPHGLITEDHQSGAGALFAALDVARQTARLAALRNAGMFAAMNTSPSRTATQNGS